MNSVSAAEAGPNVQSGQLSSLGRTGELIGYAAEVVEHVGPTNALLLGWSKMLKGRMGVEIDLDVEGLQHPLRMATTPSDYRNYREIIERQVYKLPPELEATIDGKIILDVGGYIGIAASYFASRYPDSRILSYEPSERNFGLLEVNAGRYGSQIDATRGAVVPEATPIFRHSMGAADHNFWRHQYSAPSNGDGNGEIIEEIAAITPDDILEKAGDDPIGLLKVDIEGAEKALFESGAADELLERSGIVVIETHDRFEPGCSEAIQAAAAAHGFEQLEGHDEHSALFLNPTLVEV